MDVPQDRCFSCVEVKCYWNASRQAERWDQIRINKTCQVQSIEEENLVMKANARNLRECRGVEEEKWIEFRFVGRGPFELAEMVRELKLRKLPGKEGTYVHVPSFIFFPGQGPQLQSKPQGLTTTTSHAWI